MPSIGCLIGSLFGMQHNASSCKGKAAGIALFYVPNDARSFICAGGGAILMGAGQYVLQYPAGEPTGWPLAVTLLCCGGGAL